MTKFITYQAVRKERIAKLTDVQATTSGCHCLANIVLPTRLGPARKTMCRPINDSSKAYASMALGMWFSDTMRSIYRNNLSVSGQIVY
jgi:hypothetical protein